MTPQNHLVELERKHEALERKLQDAAVHPAVDDTELAKLKRRKLQLKDELVRLRGPAEDKIH